MWVTLAEISSIVGTMIVLKVPIIAEKGIRIVAIRSVKLIKILILQVEVLNIVMANRMLDTENVM